MTPHEYQLAIAILAVVGAALFILGRYLWPALRGLNARLDDAYAQGRGDVERTAVDRVERLGLEFTLGPGGPYWRSRMFEPMPEPEPVPEPDWLAEPLSEAQERAASHLDLPGPADGDPGNPPRSLVGGRAGELHLLDWDAIRGHMTPLDVLKIEGWEIDRRWEERQAAVLASCRAAWDLAKVAA